MAASEIQIDQVRANCGGIESYEDEAIALVIERYPLVDRFGTPALVWDRSQTPPTSSEHPNWVPTYDLNAAAADIWGEIAAGYVGDFDFSTNDQRFDRSQKHEQAMAQVRYYRSRRAPTSLQMSGVSASSRNDSVTPWIINLPEED